MSRVHLTGLDRLVHRRFRTDMLEQLMNSSRAGVASPPIFEQFRSNVSVKAMIWKLSREAQYAPWHAYCRNDDREEMLWQRQQQLWDREMQRWDAERLAWTQREHYLLQQIADLQALLVQVRCLQCWRFSNSQASVHHSG